MENISEPASDGVRRAFRVVARPALLGFLGGTLAIGVLGMLASSTGLPLLIAPFGASSVLLFAAPDSAFAQPKNLVLGHLIASAVGLAVVAVGGVGIWQMAVAVGLAIAAMQLTRTVHPPAGADPLVIMLAGGVSAQFLIVPVLAGVLSLLLIALLFNNVVRGERWPRR
ncbi:HPP family protein [Paraburkholderia sp.]|uniref:HPP family protein n=1 Tax=Paraburkholderia sp. TaxID=1926495 RepID=UPI0023892B62|nr:HPP family protein [Paraburkholderia sp.]MDE1184729.1 HPP family protein [Paraburkholderia sp.]